MNPDNTDNGQVQDAGLAEFLGHPDLTKQTQAAVFERDAKKRAEMYQALQKTVIEDSPFIIMFQQVEVPVDAPASRD